MKTNTAAPSYKRHRFPAKIIARTKLIVTETCEVDTPNLITNIETATAPVADDAVPETIHVNLHEHRLLPDIHIAEMGFVNSKVFVDNKETYRIELIGPTRSDNHWQAREGHGFAAGEFVIDWDKRQAHFPKGKTSLSWTTAVDCVKNAVIKIKFATTDCQRCPSRARCTRSTPTRRTIIIRPEKQYEALQAGRQRERTDDFKAENAKRAGVEGTIAQAIRLCDVRRSWFLGEAKMHLQHLRTGAAMNVVRMLNWFAEVPKAKTKPSAFVLMYRPMT